MLSDSKPLPNPWNLYNLAGSPFFQEALQSGDTTPHPLSLFVGRGAELERLRATIRAAGSGSSRQAVAGLPGIGKTTLVKELKELALRDGYMTSDGYVPILGDDTTASVFGRILGCLYDTVIANRPQAVSNEALRDAQVLVRATRLRSGGGSLSAFGFGAGFNTADTVNAPHDLMIDGPRVVRDLSRFVLGSDARGVVLHVNNLENLSDTESARASDLIRDLRDPLFMQNGLHFIFVGSTESVEAAINSHQQVRHTVSVLRVEPLAVSEVHAMLDARYAWLKLDRGEPASSPVERAAVESLYALFRGDLRGLLKALEDGAGPLLGLTPPADANATEAGAPRPIRYDELTKALTQRYGAELASRLEPTRLRQLSSWGELDPASTQTQKSLQHLWKLKSQGAVSVALSALVRSGCVVALPRAGARPIEYVLSGVARLAFDSRHAPVSTPKMMEWP